MQYLDRRGFLRNLLIGAASLRIPRTSYGVQVEQGITATNLSDTISLVTGAGGNILVLSQPEGLLLVNGSVPERSADLMKFLGDRFKGQPVKIVFNTDWHFEHTGSNE